MPLDVQPAPHGFADRTALVTGAARGIGAAIAARLAAGGARVVVADLRAEEGAATAARIGGVFAPLDVTDEAAWGGAVATAIEATGRLDILVNNAGIEITTPIADADPEAFRRIIDVNLVGTLLGMKAAFRAMRPGGAAGQGGVVVNVSSAAANSAVPATGPYAATKAAVERLTKVGAVEAGRFGYGVRVNAVAPGVVSTALSAASAATAIELGLFPDAEALQAFVLAQTPLGRVGTPEDVAEAVAFLVSGAASYLTGVGVPVAGGMAL